MSLIFKGNKELLNENVICLFCSRSIPLSLYYPTFAFLKCLLNQSVTIAGGWHSPLEKKALKSRESTSQSNIIYYLAKGINHFTVPVKLSIDFDKGKVLIISKWKESKRIDQKKADERNKLMVDTFNRFLFLSINKNGNLESLFKSCLSLNKRVYLLDHLSNSIWMNDKTVNVSQHNFKGII